MEETWFRERYERDAANKTKQSWSEHWSWVQTFYKGKTFPPVPGWAAREKELASKAPEARADIERIGRTLAAEWAKDNAIRKVSTGDLQTWGKRMSDASRTSGALTGVLREVDEELKKRGVE